ncbi:MAG: YchJ family protein [Ketobacter sp.]|nr:MAG: YchJ family protein [Ketobacter sp.]
MDEQCPCLSGQPYLTCCAPLLSGTRKAETAGQLMRSRYCAFVKQSAEYLIQTLHPSKRRHDDAEQLRHSFIDTDWLGLTILRQELGQPVDSSGRVEFIARFLQAGRAGQIHECSEFVKEKDTWFYVDGSRQPESLPARNELCWCGNGKKFKKCHGFHR